jgi:GntR family transcriptional regulator/MocR family aminotransferase
VRARLEAALREAVQGGRLAPGTRLPPSRALAADLGIARNTVADAYGQLVAEGWLAARTGSGTWVSDQPAAPGAPASALPPSAAPARYDLRPGVPDLAAFPRREWQAAARRALAAAPGHLLGYPDPRGLPELRTALAGYLARARGVRASPERVVICGGFTHGLAVLCQVIRARGTPVLAVERYGHRHHRQLAASHGLSLLPLPVDAGGAQPEALRAQSPAAPPPSPAAIAQAQAATAQAQAAGAVLLTPAHQFPAGVTLRPQRRRAFAEWAGRTGAFVIEDDYDGEFRYDRQPVGAMQALAPESVVYAGTASKSLVPGLRLGWLVLPTRLLDEVVAAMEAGGWLGGVLDQLTLAEFINCGGYDRQVRHARLSYRRRRDRLAAALRQEAPGVAVTGIAAGLHALVRLRPGQTEDEVTARAAGRGLALDGLASYRAGPPLTGPPLTDRAAGRVTDRAGGAPASGQQALVVGYARPPGHAFTAALARLCAVLSE